MFGKKIKEITTEEFEKKRDNGESFIIVDVCEPFEFEIRKIEGAINIPFLDLNESTIKNLPGITFDSQIVVYCAHGIRSKRAAAYFASLGYLNVYSLIGGIAQFLNSDY